MFFLTGYLTPLELEQGHSGNFLQRVRIARNAERCTS